MALGHCQHAVRARYHGRTGPDDVFVVDGEGLRIPWSDVARFNDDEMRAVMRDIVNHLHTFHTCADAPGLQAEIARWMGVASRWDEPEAEPRMLARRNEPGCCGCWGWEDVGLTKPRAGGGACLRRAGRRCAGGEPVQRLPGDRERLRARSRGTAGATTRCASRLTAPRGSASLCRLRRCRWRWDDAACRAVFWARLLRMPG